MIHLKIDLTKFPDIRDLLKEVAKNVPNNSLNYEVR